MSIRTWIWGSLLLVGAASYGLLEWSVDDWSRDFIATAAATSSATSEVDLQPINSDRTTDAAQRAVLKAVENLDGWEYVDLEDQMADRILHLRRTSPYLKIVDDVTVTISIHEDSVIIAATSKSRSTWGDFGRNTRNIKQLFKAVRSNLWTE
jgi:uncharacterized protein (DUF1499 family)